MAFHKGLDCLPRQNNPQRKKNNFILEMITCDPLIFTMYHLQYILYQARRKNPLVHKGFLNLNMECENLNKSQLEKQEPPHTASLHKTALRKTSGLAHGLKLTTH